MTDDVVPAPRPCYPIQVEYPTLIDKVAPALVAAQAAVSNVTKDTNGQGYRYATLSQLVEMLRPILAANDLAVLQTSSLSPSSSDSAGMIRLGDRGQYGSIGDNVVTETHVVHSSGQRIVFRMESPPATMSGSASFNGAQVFGSTQTYSRRYALGAVFLVAAEEDDDAGGASPEPRGDRPAARRQKPAPPARTRQDARNGSGRSNGTHAPAGPSSPAQEADGPPTGEGSWKVAVTAAAGDVPALRTLARAIGTEPNAYRRTHGAIAIGNALVDAAEARRDSLTVEQARHLSDLMSAHAAMLATDRVERNQKTSAGLDDVTVRLNDAVMWLDLVVANAAPAPAAG